MLLIGNGRLITRSEELPYLEDGAVVLDGEVVKEVGSLADMKAKYPDAEFVDAKGGVIMPGLINVHTHIYSGLARGLSINGFNPTNFFEVLDGQWWYIDRHLTLDGDPRLRLRHHPGLHPGRRDHHLRSPRLLLRDPRLPLCHQGRVQGAGYARQPLLRGVRA